MHIITRAKALRLGGSASPALLRHQLLRRDDNRRVVAEAIEPMHQGFFAEPGHLPLGVASGGLGDGFGGGSKGDRASK